MQMFLRILTLFQVLVCVEMKKTGTVFTGTEGGSVEIDCSYPDEYIYVKKYLCRHPCSDILIESEKYDEVFSKGRYSLVNTLSTKSFSVTIKNLSLKDSGVYYCGVEAWGKDIYTKLKVYVKKASVTAVPLQTTKPTDWTSSSTHMIYTAGNSIQASSLTTSTNASVPQGPHITFSELPVYGGVLGLLLCCVLVALVVFYRKRASSPSTSLKAPAPENQISAPPPHEREVFHVYDEMTVYSLAGPAITENPSETYSVIQHAPPEEEDCSPYSLVGPH